MTHYVGVGGAHKTVRKISVGVGGVWKNVARKWVGVGGVWKLAFTYFSATASDATASLPVGNVVSATSTVTVAGGTGPFTYAWSITSGTGFTLSNATA